MAASSSTSCDDKKTYQYDVFLSFCGEDTRTNFVDHLNEALKRHGIRTFKDDERLHKGKEIKNELLKSIDDSRFSVIVFSKKYASSSWCLDELVKIMECHNTTDQTAFPVFYDVEPTEVRKQSGQVGEAFAKHLQSKKVLVRKTFNRTLGKAVATNSVKKLGKWRKALKDAANLSGWELKNSAHGHEAKVIDLVVERVSLELRSINMDVDENMVGMERRMQDLDQYLQIEMNDVRIIGIKGMGGAGKTTLAQAIFNKISFNFEGKSFVEHVKENSKASFSGLKNMQKQVLQDVLKDKGIDVSNVNEGRNFMKTMLCGQKVLLVLDDVDNKDQLEALAGAQSWFKSGSRIIITTRNEQILIAHGVKLICEVTLLSEEEAIRLFYRYAFQEDIQTQEYEELSLKVVRYAAGLPLTIKVLGSSLCGKTMSVWEDALSRLKTIPLKETLTKLEVSFESLENDHKEIFLDVACFFRNWEKDDAVRILESCGFYAISGLRVLEQKSLIKIVQTDLGGTIQLHDHIVEMGENIVRRGNPYEPKTHSRLWVQEEIEHVLANGLGTEATWSIKFRTTNGINLEPVGNMTKLRCLIINRREVYPFDPVVIHEARQYLPSSLRYLYWRKYSHWCLPNTFEANNLVSLEMPYSEIEQLWKGKKVMKKLKFLDLSNNVKLKSLDLGMMPNLERLNLHKCSDLVKIDVRGACLKRLLHLNLNHCRKLKSSFLNIDQFESLELLYMYGSNPMERFLDDITTGHSTNSLLELDLSDNKDIKEVPSSIGNLHKLVSLSLGHCRSLEVLPGSIFSLQHLRTLNLGWCTSIKELPDGLGQLKCLENLNLGGIKVDHLPDDICMLIHLKTLNLETCRVLKKLPDSIGMLKHLKTLNLGWCCDLENLPDSIGMLESLEKLDLSFCDKLRDIPSNICKLKRLKQLMFQCCWKLTKLPDNLGDLKSLQVLAVRKTDLYWDKLPPSILLLKGLKII